MMQDDSAEDVLDQLCREALRVYRLDAFNNVEVPRLLEPQVIAGEEARRIGQHLMRAGRSLAACRHGQLILRQAGNASAN